MRTAFLLIGLSFALILAACAEEPATPLQGTVSWVYDGDTLEIDTVGKVRMVGIDTPERENSSRDQYLAKQGISAAKQRQLYLAAKNFNISQVKGQKVKLTLEDPPRDRYNRLLAYVHLQDGRLLNRILIEKGLAVVYRRFAFKKKDDFLAAEAQARRSRAGMWSDSSLPLEGQE